MQRCRIEDRHRTIFWSNEQCDLSASQDDAFCPTCDQTVDDCDVARFLFRANDATAEFIVDHIMHDDGFVFPSCDIKPDIDHVHVTLS